MGLSALHSDRLSYDVQFNLTAPRPYVLITATGTPKHRRHPVARSFSVPPPIPAQRCRDRTLEAEWFLPENPDRRKNGTDYWRKHQARYQELSQMAEEYVRADMEYWRELELLSGQRQHHKPGLTDETRYGDDEVAA
jgi:hypothetical protein